VRKWSEAEIQSALARAAELRSVAAAARECGIPERTLRDARMRTAHVTKRTQPEKSTSGVIRALVCPDVHAPNHNAAAWELTLEAARVWKPDVWVFIGDVIDHVSISHHPRSPDRRMFLKEEIGQVNQLLDQVQGLRIPRVIFLSGNHEEWLGRYIRDKAPELFGLVSIKDLLEIEGRGWEWYAYQEPVKLGKLHLVHDVGRCGKHTAVASLADYGHSIVMGHSHRAAVIYDGTADGERRVAMNVGTLIDIETVEYRSRAMARREWQTGFGIAHILPNGDAFCTFCPIVNGRTVVDGKVIEA
jgi:hypothetical protein